MKVDNFQYEIMKEFFNVKLGPAEHRRFQILQAGFELLRKKGLHGLTFTELGRKCRISRPLIHHHYKDKQALVLDLMNLCTLNLQKYVSQEIQNAASDQALEIYCRATLRWALSQPGAALVLIHFLELSIHNSILRRRNDELSELGRQKIKNLILEVGHIHKLESKARAIQCILTGGVINLLAEEFTSKSRDIFIQNLTDHCLEIAKA